jgi:hypothetical protein
MQAPQEKPFFRIPGNPGTGIQRKELESLTGNICNPSISL